MSISQYTGVFTQLRQHRSRSKMASAEPGKVVALTLLDRKRYIKIMIYVMLSFHKF